MAKLIITGNIKPIVGNTEMYSLSAFDNLMTSNALLSLSPKIQWNLHVQDKKGWRIATGNTKEGEHITYKFTHKSLQYKSLKIVVTRGKDKGEFYIKPQEAEESKITRVDILDINGQRLPKGKRLHYTETLIVKAHCVGMFGQKVSFTLWEDDAIGKGHDPVINMMNRINPMPLIGEVDHQGIARVVFRLPSYTMAVQIANAGLAKGDRSEDNTHEYYVTAELVSKHILVASPNVNVVNPTHLPDPVKKPKSDEVKSTSAKPPVNSPHKEKINKPKPKEETAKFPQSPAAKKQADPEGKILSAEFTDGTGKTLKNAKTGDVVSIKMVTQNMKEKNVIVRIWEEDFSRYSNDLLYEKTVTLRYHTCNVINNVKLTRQMYTKSNEWGEGSEREYFIEVEHLNTSVTSQVIPVSVDGEKAEVDENDSVAVIKEIKEEKKESKVCECEARVRAYMRMLRVGEATGELIKSSKYNKETRKSEIIYISHDFQKGYITAFGGNKITDLSTHPQKKYGGSSAAGAYQIMRYSWWWLNGEKLNKNKSKAGIYESHHDYIKKYKISDYFPESQDKVCVIIMKHKQKGLLELIISNNIEKAIRNQGSAEWASLPYDGDTSRYEYEGKQQPATPFKTCMEHYEKFLKDELKGISPLHLKKGFLKEFGYECCAESLKKESTSEGNGKWRNPIDNPMLCLYSQGGGFKPWHGSFGEKIRDNTTKHTGNDLLAIPGTKVYACLKSVVHKIYTSGSMAGNVVVLKVLDTETFKSIKRKDYVPKYKSKSEILEKGFNENGTIYLTFWHLSKNDFFKEGDEVEYNDVIGLTGISGWKGKNFTTRNPHLHFEISNIGSAKGLDGKCNPSVYFKFKTEDELSQSEINFQNKLKDKEWK
ncbi:Peptidase family M23 [Chryseobacterium ureilyticum]|uniref:Peptidase family M23 n=1 Tax=Chryseobacterium ureilyticum TaxID=373668 RepID=A0A1N7KTQ5_9FLAO|nr:peptidoglycan DD-metalloendopeptidase family protein [Chryseobacterium ureilyticum]SIS64931.1 Peptidase family M23 [Chryseobacterium ureilyticum]